MNDREQYVVQQVQAKLFAMQDQDYQKFQAKLMPTIDQETVIGVRTPMLRSYAKAFGRTPEAKEFLQILPHTYYEENNLHAFLIEQMKDYNECMQALNQFLPWVDNWATCDSMKPKIFRKHLKELREQINTWLRSDQTYTVRYGIGALMGFFLEADTFQMEYLEQVAGLRSEEYYVNMMISWYFATALAKQWDAAIAYIEKRRLDCWCHNKTIQKAVESYRIAPEQKDYLRSLRWK